MISRWQTKAGVQGGLMAGAAVLVFFFLFDLARLEPLATPFSLSARLLGPSGPTVDMPVISQILAIAIFAGNLLSLTVLHFLAFSLLGVGAIWGCENCRFPLNFATGALLGVTVGTGAYYACMATFGDRVLAGSPGVPGVLAANLVAGALLGGFYQFRRAVSSW
ncbi:MAG: hypothetical protein PVJ76_16140 [Gemmatimonadota bacterium]|jgi:hypothetical protein